MAKAWAHMTRITGSRIYLGTWFLDEHANGACFDDEHGEISDEKGHDDAVDKMGRS